MGHFKSLKHAVEKLLVPVLDSNLSQVLGTVDTVKLVLLLLFVKKLVKLHSNYTNPESFMQWYTTILYTKI